MDHMRRGTLRFDNLKMAVLDEADVMLNMGFRDDIELILQAAPKERQTVFFSATMPRPIRDLIEKYARNPQNVKIEQKAMTVPTVEQVYYEVDRRFKIELLTRLIDIHDIKLGIIFCNTKRMVDDLVDHLEAQGYMADRLHGDMTQAMRDRVMNKFRKSGWNFSSPRTSPRAALTWTTCKWCSTTICRTTAKITCIASAARAARVAGAPFRSCPGASCFRSATSSAIPTCAGGRGQRQWRDPAVDERG
jgi:hypothetical protein